MQHPYDQDLIDSITKITELRNKLDTGLRQVREVIKLLRRDLPDGYYTASDGKTLRLNSVGAAVFGPGHEGGGRNGGESTPTQPSDQTQRD